MFKIVCQSNIVSLIEWYKFLTLGNVCIDSRAIDPIIRDEMANHTLGSKPIDIYFYQASPPSRAVLMLIKGLDLNHNVIITNIMEQDNLKPEFLKLNPLHTIPVINDNGFVLYDSHVILKYLADTYGRDDVLCPKEPKKEALVSLRCYFDACYLFPKFLAYFMPIFQKKINSEEALQNLKDVIKLLDGFLEDSNFVAGDHLTIADISIIATMSTIEACGVVDMDDYPNTREWLKRTKTALNRFSFMEVCQPGAELFGQFYRGALNHINNE